MHADIVRCCISSCKSSPQVVRPAEVSRRTRPVKATSGLRCVFQCLGRRSSLPDPLSMSLLQRGIVLNACVYKLRVCYFGMGLKNHNYWDVWFPNRRADRNQIPRRTDVSAKQAVNCRRPAAATRIQTNMPPSKLDGRGRAPIEASQGRIDSTGRTIRPPGARISPVYIYIFKPGLDSLPVYHFLRPPEYTPHTPRPTWSSTSSSPTTKGSSP